MERMRYLIPKSQDDQQRQHLIFELIVYFVGNADKRRIQIIQIRNGNIALFDPCTS